MKQLFWVPIIIGLAMVGLSMRRHLYGRGRYPTRGEIGKLIGWSLTLIVLLSMYVMFYVTENPSLEKFSAGFYLGIPLAVLYLGDNIRRLLLSLWTGKTIPEREQE